eukprot:CAMPEP_0179123364 /NCGR_PEP_ID=MMETSP0796-20121207/58259_1 /TAXON_ID=73915 /ORGANISM="Pyrodinium bahamense, Strain pbaha01" /LENGTH=151 /DNA_ID=CAMNT_0020822007 /DNA_START=74 /DNA_END=526 /DNA_ORIENTATION=+
MTRSRGGIGLGVIVAIVACSALNQLAAFVGPSPASTGYRRHWRRVVIMAAISKDDVQKAERDAKLAVWAAQRLASEGAPQAPAMQDKADKALQALEALKQQFQGQEVPALAPAAPVLEAAGPTLAAAAPGAISKDDIQKAEKDARLFVWAA